VRAECIVVSGDGKSLLRARGNLFIAFSRSGREQKKKKKEKEAAAGGEGNFSARGPLAEQKSPRGKSFPKPRRAVGQENVARGEPFVGGNRRAN